jgi:hypothetical protein
VQGREYKYSLGKQQIEFFWTKYVFHKMCAFL